MPTKIVSKKSNPSGAEINEDDLNQIMDDFDTNCQIKSTIKGRSFVKTNSVSIPLSLMESFVAFAKEKQMKTPNDLVYVKIKFGITLPGQKDCADGEKDISNQLTVVLLVQENNPPDIKVKRKVSKNNFIITPGFKALDSTPKKEDTKSVNLKSFGAVAAPQLNAFVCCPQGPPYS